MKARPGDKLAVGSFVKVTSKEGAGLGIGKVIKLVSNWATVAYFDVPGEGSPFQMDTPVSAVRAIVVPEQTRVFRLDELTGHWQVGRIIDGEGPTCLVAFPNRQPTNVPRGELEVRWRKPIADPVEFLTRQVTETPRFSEARSNFVRAVTSQRAACRGMSALLSSSVQLADYQFNVVQRVLQDPVQRYLLADEVGLGKTIEAGLLIRQYVLDFPDARVLLIVPAPLVAQWREELDRRFGLADWLDDFVYVVSHDDLASIIEHISTVGMLVVDEAHHLSRQTLDMTGALYELLRQHTPRLQRLLLLSATPVLSDTAGFLRMLHLLDPVVFPLNDIVGFERRLRSRQLVAEIIGSLVPENVLSMEDDLDRLHDAFRDDPALVRRVEALRPIVRALPDESDSAFLTALSELRTQLSETYKLHRRILRNRRRAVSWATPRRSGLELLPYVCAWRRERYGVLDDLRVHLTNANLIVPVAWAVFTEAVHAPERGFVEATLHAAGIDDRRARELARRADALASKSSDEGHRGRVVVEATQRCLETPGVQIVVFCDQVSVADGLADLLERSLRSTTEVLRHTCPDSCVDVEAEKEPWYRFLTEPERCRVLVCDARAEEGLNLHGGRKVAVHFDLPAAPNRIEQRLGRLDRFGAGDAIRSMAPVCTDDLAEQAWLSCLADGLKVFDSSMASLQYLVEESLHSTVTDWCNEGVDGLFRWKEKLAGPTGWVARERRRIDQQDAIDAMGDPQSDAFDELEAVDDNWRTWRDAFEGFALTTLLFQRRSEEWTGVLPLTEQVFRLKYSRSDNSPTLLSLPDFLSQFLGTIDTEANESTARAPLTYPYAFRRHTVMSKEGRSRGLRSLRYGDPLVESLRAFCEGDDRGRVFAMWRHRVGFQARDASRIDLWFRFDFLVEADLPVPTDDASRALRRRAEQHFAPRFYTVWVDMTGAVTMEPRDELAEPYLPADGGSGRDFTLNPRRWQILNMQDYIPWTVGWRQHCEQAAQTAHAFIVAHEALLEHIAQSLNAVVDQHKTLVARLESRIVRLEGAARAAERRDLEVECSMQALLASAIRHPSVRTDTVGAIFISALTPFVR